MQSGFRIFHVEDNPADAEILRIALAQTGIVCEITVFESGVEVLSHLDSLSRTETAAPEAPPVPACDLLLLDMNLPRMNGFEVLESIRSKKAFGDLHIIVMSGSRNPEEIDRCMRLGASGYLPKGSRIEETFGVAEQLAVLLKEMKSAGTSRAADI